MAHRLAFPSNSVVPLATKISEPGSGWLQPYDPAVEPADALSLSPADHDSVSSSDVYAQIEMLALDTTPIDALAPTGDSLWMRAAFTDTLGRQVEVRATDVVPGAGDEEHYGGIATNLYHYMEASGAEEALWYARTLAGWARSDVLVDGALTDSSMLCVIDLLQPLTTGTGEPIEPLLTVAVCPARVDANGLRTSTPMQAAEELGMAGWRLVWRDVDYYQAPVMSVRLERGDTPSKVAKELVVDLEAILHANPKIDLNETAAGALLRVPMLVRATSAAPKKEHPSVALTWKEIITGWTTLN